MRCLENGMKIEYVRNIQSGYMRMAVQTPLKEIEEEMLRHNKIEGILPAQWQRENDSYVLSYDITGKQALDKVLENVPAEERFLKGLFIGIQGAIKQLEKYLLPEEGLLLLPETIFWEYKTETVHFCYCPEWAGGLREQFVSLLEYLLVKTNHNNVTAVKLIYGVYDEAVKPTFYMKELEELLRAQLTETEEVCEERSLINGEVVLEKRAFIMPEREGKKGEGIEKIMAFIRKGIQKKKKKEYEKGAVLHKEAETGIQEEATTILGSGEEITSGCLKYEGINYLPDILITKTPIVIGTAENCDGIIKHPNISHYHAKISCQDHTYFIEDLNSTNGTRVNGGLLSYKTKVSLKKNTSICFANEQYRFF